MQEPSSRRFALCIRLAVFGLVWGFCLPGAAVLVEMVRQGRFRRIPAPVEVSTIAISAILLAACVMSRGLLTRSLGWAVACLGHAALVNAMVPDRPAELQLIWLVAGTALGALVGLSAGSPRKHEQDGDKPDGSGSREGEAAANRSFGARPRVSRRAVMAGVLVSGVVVACAVRYEICVATQARIAEAVVRSAGHTIHDTPSTPPLLFKWLDGMCDSDEHLCLRSVELGAGAGNDELAELAAMGLGRLPYLRELRLRSSQVTDEGMVTVVSLVEIERLSLGPATTDAGLAQLAVLPALRTLDLTHTRITGNGLRSIAHLPALTFLSLHDTQVTSDDLAQLKAFPQLATLDLSATPIADAGLVHLKGLAHLTSLILHRTSITDAGLVHLAEIPQLRWLFVAGSKVTRAGLRDFQRVRPGVMTD